MALKFKCTECGKNIFVKYLRQGETAKCRNCSAMNTVPESAIEVSKEDVPQAYYIPEPQNLKKLYGLEDSGEDEKSKAEKFEVWDKRICRVIGIFLLLGSIIGLYFVYDVMADLRFTAVTFILLLIIGGLYVLSLVIGIGLVGKNIRGRLGAKILMFIQIPIIKSSVISFVFVSGVRIIFYFEQGNYRQYYMGVESLFRIAFPPEGTPFGFGINLYALAAFIYLMMADRKRSKIKKYLSEEAGESGISGNAQNNI